MAKLALPPLAPTPQGAAIARVPRQALLRFARARADEATHDVPRTDGTDQARASVVALLMKIRGSMGEAHNVSIIPLVTELSTVHAAGVLNVLRLFPVALLEKAIFHIGWLASIARSTWNVICWMGVIDNDRTAVLVQRAGDVQQQGNSHGKR